jgi:hypothetical protein
MNTSKEVEWVWYAHTKVAHSCWGTIVSEVGKHDIIEFEE